MTFPHHDPGWTSAADFLSAHSRAGDDILAPDIFHQLFPRIYRYVNTRLRPDMAYDWAVIHKGELASLSQPFLATLARAMAPVFANEVFVLWSARRAGGPSPLAASLPHVKAYFDALARLDPARSADRPEDDPALARALPDPGAIVDFAELDDGAVKQAMDSFWRRGGYTQETPRDHAVFAEVERCIASFAGDGAGQVILDLCCGTGKLKDIITRSPSVIGVDISEVAIEMARAGHADRPEFSFEVMDAHALALPSAYFDLVLFVESIEHVRDYAAVLRETARVTKPGGHLLVTTANRDSLHLVVNRKLGYPGFKTSFQHVKEFSYRELAGLIGEFGFDVRESAGIFLYPYWGIPGIDGVVREVTDNDPEMIETLRQLGARIGAEHAYIFAIWAQRRPS